MKTFLAQVLLLSLVASSTAFAQTTNATLGGTVSDASRALIPGVMVTATNTQTGIVTSVITNETGAYQFASLQTGVYKVTADLPGFQTQTYNDVTLGVGQQVRLNFTMQVSGQTQTVEVNVAPDTLIATTSASVGTVLPDYRVRELPLATRNVLDLATAMPGAQGSNFAGTRLTQLNTTRDGIPVSDGRYDIGAATSTFTSPDLVDEVRVIVAPADAELGRGVGQIQMSTRSGTNQFRGSVFWVNRNSKLAANSWENNFKGAGKNFYNGNQFGGRIGGPIIKNKTFFFFLYDGQRYVTKSYFTGAVLTEQARQGIFRFFPTVGTGGHAASNNPQVDRSGNPVTPRDASGQPVPLSSLTSVNVFGRDVNGTFTPWDANRREFDTSGWIKRLVDRMPKPNDFTTCGTSGIFTATATSGNCDGLNVAGHRWLRRSEGVDVANGDGQDTNRNQSNVRIDHNFNSRHKASFSGTWERDWAETTQAGISNWPGGYNGSVKRAPRVLTGSLVSTVSPTVVNEFRFGSRKNWNYSWSSIWRPDEVGDQARSALPTKGGVPFYPTQVLFGDNIITSVSGAATRGQTSPLWTFSDTLSWTQGVHAFKGGYELRLTSSRGFNGIDDPELYKIPVVAVSGPSVPVTGINTVPGLTGTAVTTAQNLLLDLSGSASNLTGYSFNVLNPGDDFFSQQVRIKDYHQTEWGAFFKDDWKIRPDLTLNLGLRYDWYGVPWEKSGMHALPVGGTQGLYGISAGSLTALQLVGKNSPNPDTLFYQNDWNNFGPAVGISWSLPWFGKDKTVLRAGYGISYQGAASYNAGLNVASGNNPGLSEPQNFAKLGLSNTYVNFASPSLPVPVPPPASTVKPLTPQPFNTRSDPLVGFDDNRVNPYVQSYNLEIQRELARNLTFEARYIGSKGTKLFGGISLNDVNIYAQAAGQTLLDAFNQTRAGLDAPLFDVMLRGITVNPGQTVGTNVSGSAALRQNSNFRTLLANGNVGQFANQLNIQTTGVTTGPGGWLRANGLPENWLVANPQYAAVALQTNPASSTYHSMNLQVTKRLSQGFASSFAYTWSRTLGEAAGDGNVSYLDPNNHHLNKQLLNFHRTHDIRSNAFWELPFGPNQKFLSSAPRILSRIVERWQLGGIMIWRSGEPLTITAANSETTWTQVPGQIAIVRTQNMPNILGEFPKSSGELKTDSNGGYYFAGLTQSVDPFRSNITTQQGLQDSFSNQVIRDANGKIILASPSPGVVGTLGRTWIEGPGHIKLDMNLTKRFRIDETKNFEIRMDVVDILNTPYWNNPVVDINDVNFGRMNANDFTTGASNADNRSANRKFTFTARVNF